jgi:hypothetical protein
MPSPERFLLPDAELSRPALVLAQRFVQRWDLYARQLDNGRYICVHETLNVGQLFDHLRGEITLGTYLLDQESKARFIVLDADDEQGWERLGHLAGELADENVPVYLEKSRRGGHLWLFLAQAVAGREVRVFGKGLLAAHQIEGVELYPKQDQLADGPGSLIRMPFGVHRLTGRCYGFYTADGYPLAPTIREQIYTLGAPETVPKAAFEGLPVIRIASTCGDTYGTARNADRHGFREDQGQRDGAGVCQSIRGSEANGKWCHRLVPLPRRPPPELWGQRRGQLLALLCWLRWGIGD